MSRRMQAKSFFGIAISALLKALGRLAFRELISEAQHQAGVAFGQLYRDHHVTVGLPSPSPRSVAGLLINEGIFGASPSEPVLEVIEKLKRRFGAATDALDACDREHRLSRGQLPTLLVYRVICSDEDAMHWPEEDIGNLRVALNALVRLFRLVWVKRIASGSENKLTKKSEIYLKKTVDTFLRRG
jgi:hypothetical protein